MKYKNKVAIITGAGRGIGFALSIRLAQEGVLIVANDINNVALIALKEEVIKANSNVAIVHGDAGSVSCIQKMVDTAIEKFGRLDFVIANAGVTNFGSFLDFSEEKFDALAQLNLKGSFFLAQAAAKAMTEREIRGRILMMSSVTGYQYHKDLVAYGMTKAALRFLVKALGVELARKHITVNAIAPGATLTERTEGLSKDYEKIWKSITPNGEVATVEHICHSALFFLDQTSSHITGQTLLIDGGWTSTSPQP